MPTAADQERIATFIARIAGKPAKAQQMYALSELSRIHRRRHDDGTPYAATTNRTLISDYRAAVRSVMGENAPVLKTLRYSAKRAQEYREQQTSSRVERHRNQRPLDAERHVEAAETVLEYHTKLQWSTAAAIAGVIALTGRRPYEVACVGRMTADPDDENRLLFSGQTKTRDTKRANQTYPIPVLARRDLVLDAIERIRTDIDPGTPNSTYSQRWGKYVGQAAKRYFCDDNQQPIIPRELREAYAAIAYHMYAPDGITAVQYYNEVLGHVEGDLNTTLFYFDFYIKDQPQPDPTVPWIEDQKAKADR